MELRLLPSYFKGIKRRHWAWSVKRVQQVDEDTYSSLSFYQLYIESSEDYFQHNPKNAYSVSWNDPVVNLNKAADMGRFLWEIWIFKPL